MKKGTKIFLGVVGVLGLVVLGWVIYDHIRKKRESEAAAAGGAANAGAGGTSAGTQGKPSAPAPVSTVTPAYTALPEGDFPLKKGSKSRLVWLLQLYLNARYSAGLSVDGNFGPATEYACQRNLGTTQVTKAKAEEIIRSVPTAQAYLFVEYADLVGRKISGTLGAAIKNW